ncbi:hypothetical protein LIER_33046 [Lithospermum erythrorhizon]|uniref:Uncharacterized protein n=1 Tax=Lithospermum erythrorhizon TaxID=34254 RepID=A0AAV3RVK4_LITER
MATRGRNLTPYRFCLLVPFYVGFSWVSQSGGRERLKLFACNPLILCLAPLRTGRRIREEALMTSWNGRDWMLRRWQNTIKSMRSVKKILIWMKICFGVIGGEEIWVDGVEFLCSDGGEMPNTRWHPMSFQQEKAG